MKRIIEKFKDVHILVVGDLMMDHYVWGKVERISPEAPVPVVAVKREDFRLGGAGNVVNNIVALGGKASVTGVAGQDEKGRLLKQLFKQYQVSDKGIFHEDGRHTSVKTRIIAHNQQVVRIDRELIAEINQRIMDDIVNFVEQNLSSIQGIIVSDYAKGVISRELIQRILDLVGHDVYVAVDPKIGHFDYYQDVDIITPNLKEAAHGAGFDITDMPSLLKAGRVLLEKLHCLNVLITRGEEGMSLFESDGTVVHIPPTCTRRVFDVTGAGDTVIATFVLARCGGASMEEAAVIANYAAGIVVGEVGTATVNSKTLINEIIVKEKYETC